jgi:pimeloyl-ACP methyl ester carboxylesterase
LLGQVNERRQPFTRADAEQIPLRALLIGGGASTGAAPVILQALAAHMPDLRIEFIPATTHVMFEQDPGTFCNIVVSFLDHSGGVAIARRCHFQRSEAISSSFPTGIAPLHSQ